MLPWTAAGSSLVGRHWAVAAGLWALAGGAVAQPSAGQTWAVVVGVDDYIKPGVPDLRYACSDAKLLAQALRELMQVPADHLFVFTTDETTPEKTPSVSNIVLRLDWLRKNSKPQDTVIFFFAGHGATIDGESFLLTEEADNRSLATLKVSALSARDLDAYVRRAPASHTLMLLDACRDDPRSGSAALDAALVQNLSLTTANQESATLFSCSVGQRSWEWDAKKHGFFTYFLVEGLRSQALDGEGYVTLASLTQFLSKSVPAASLQNLKVEQTPIVRYEGPALQGWRLAGAVQDRAQRAIAGLDRNVASQDLAACERSLLENRLRLEEARRRELEIRLQGLEQKAPAVSSEEVQRLTLARDLALKELGDTRKQLDELRSVVATSGRAAELNLLLAEKDQLRAENRVLQARIALLEGKLAENKISFARSFQLQESQPESDPQREVERLLGQSQQLRVYHESQVSAYEEALRAAGRLAAESIQANLALQEQLDRARETITQLKSSAQLSEVGVELARARLEGKEDEGLRRELQQTRQRLWDLAELDKKLLADERYRRRAFSRWFRDRNSMPGMGDILDVIRVGPEAQTLDP